ncbi:MAG: hypothetical protein LAT55_07015 [Opitutales bacterium]|nr:hypothetical protein [Opitutales bacterium]
MKSIYLLFGLFLVGSLHLAFSEQKIGSFPMEIEDVELFFVFADDGLSEDEKAFIVEDYTFVLAAMNPRFEASYAARGRPDTGEKIGGIALRKFSYEGPALWPQPWGDEFGLFGTTEDGKKFLFISKKLSDRYREAITLINQYPEAYHALSDFIEMVNHPTATNVPHPKDFAYLNREDNRYDFKKEEIKNQTKDDLIEQLIQMTISPTSILTLRKIEGELMIAFYLEISSESAGFSKQGVMWSFIYQDDYWKMYYGIGGALF